MKRNVKNFSDFIRNKVNEQEEFKIELDGDQAGPEAFTSLLPVIGEIVSYEQHTGASITNVSRAAIIAIAKSAKDKGILSPQSEQLVTQVCEDLERISEEEEPLCPVCGDDPCECGWMDDDIRTDNL